MGKNSVVRRRCQKVGELDKIQARQFPRSKYAWFRHQMSDSVEKQLIERALSKDFDALQKIVFLRHDWLIAVARKKIPVELQSVVDPEDVVQDAFVRIFTHFDTFEPIGEAALFRWMERITQNLAIDALRKQTRAPQALNSSNRSEAGLDDLVEDLQLSDLTASSVLRKRELKAAFDAALEKLSPEYRSTIELLYLQSKSLEEVAEIMGKSPGTVRGYRQRAREKLRESIIRLSFYV